MLPLRLMFALAALVLSGLIVWAFQAPFWESFGIILNMPWGLVTLVDLYLGFIAFSVMMAVLEPNKPLAAFLVLAMFILGNVVSAGWLAWRGLHLLKTHSFPH